jgi:hypothetical protein
MAYAEISSTIKQYYVPSKIIIDTNPNTPYEKFSITINVVKMVIDDTTKEVLSTAEAGEITRLLSDVTPETIAAVEGEIIKLMFETYGVQAIPGPIASGN